MKHKISVFGLGYVGLPLAIEFSKYFKTIGYDANNKRIDELKSFKDSNNEISKNIIKNSNIKFTNNLNDLKKSNTYIVTVPTPIDKLNKPDLTSIYSACKNIGNLLKKKDLVIFESTVYPGLTEEKCIPLIEKISKLKLNRDFYCGYSPERVNPGDQKRTLEKIIKVTSGSNNYTLEIVDNLYKKIIKAGTHKVSSIKIAEAAKIIENTQRDLNVAFVNELSMLFYKMNINTQEVLEAASTKWNFLNFKPGLVGGHCIGVDPYYLTYKAKELGFKPKIILSGRNVNNNMGKFIVSVINKKFKKDNKFKTKNKYNVLVMGFTFKENCSDIRNTKVADMIKLLNRYTKNIDIFDPLVNEINFKKEYKYNLIHSPKNNYYDFIIISVAHNIFKEIGILNIKKFGNSRCSILDLKYLFDKKYTDIRL